VAEKKNKIRKRQLSPLRGSWSRLGTFSQRGLIQLS